MLTGGSADRGRYLAAAGGGLMAAEERFAEARRDVFGRSGGEKVLNGCRPALLQILDGLECQHDETR